MSSSATAKNIPWIPHHKTSQQDKVNIKAKAAAEGAALASLNAGEGPVAAREAGESAYMKVLAGRD